MNFLLYYKVYLPVYKINHNNSSNHKPHSNTPIQVPISSGFSFSSDNFQQNRFSNSIDHKLLDNKKLEALENFNNVNQIQVNSRIEEYKVKRKRNSSNSSDRSLKIDEEDDEEVNDRNSEDTPLDLSTKNNRMFSSKKQNLNLINNQLIEKSQRFINDAFLNGLISPIENDSIKNYLNKKHKTSLNHETFLRDNYYSDFMRKYQFNLIQGQTNIKTQSNIGVSLSDNIKFQNSSIELVNDQKHNYNRNFNIKKGFLDLPSVSNRPNLPVLNQISSLTLSEKDKLYKCNYCKELLNLEKVNIHKCIVIQNLLKQQSFDFSNNPYMIKELNRNIDMFHPTTKPLQFSNLLSSISTLNSNLNKNNIDEEQNESFDDNETKKIDSFHINGSNYENKIYFNDEHDKEELEDLLKHPLVKKTLSEIYGECDIEKLFSFKDAINEKAFNINNRHFFICTNCGYRGNTSRGVKQHGKMHIHNNEHFSIINATEKLPLIVYSSKQDSDVNIVNKSKSKADMNDYNLNDEENNYNIIANNTESDSKELKQNCSSDNSIESSDNSILKMQSLTGDLRSETYCFKCGIQFQQIKNFLAHKKSYCNDN